MLSHLSIWRLATSIYVILGTTSAVRFNSLGLLNALAPVASAVVPDSVRAAAGYQPRTADASANEPVGNEEATPQLTPEEIQTMQSAAATSSSENLKLQAELKELEHDVQPLNDKIESLTRAGDVDNQRKANFRRFRASIPSKAMESFVSSIGQAGGASSLLEAPIIILQPSAPSLADSFAVGENAADEHMIQAEKRKELEQEIADQFTTSEEIEREMKAVRRRIADIQEEERILNKELDSVAEVIKTKGPGALNSQHTTLAVKLHSLGSERSSLEERLHVLNQRRQELVQQQQQEEEEEEKEEKAEAEDGNESRNENEMQGKDEVEEKDGKETSKSGRNK